MNVNEFITIYSGGNYAAPIWDEYSSYVLELITNGDFATDTAWAKGTEWTIGGGVASCDGTQSGLSYLNQSGAIVSGKTYKATYEIISISAGEIRIFVGGVSGTPRTTTGVYTEYITAGSTDFWLRGSSSFVGSIDNVSVKEVGESVEGRDCTINNLARLIS